ncbi:uncharacterized protein LOC115302425 [Suricata suricatta]|uniref:uncharacterized protein LOC115302425 n=1 Tax=Suricata suricatta TaxID=37032 RepID=UPI001155BEB7|nr:uncharacterized protein LOC115302425 [Suricata suricatta]
MESMKRINKGRAALRLEIGESLLPCAWVGGVPDQNYSLGESTIQELWLCTEECSHCPTMAPVCVARLADLPCDPGPSASPPGPPAAPLCSAEDRGRTGGLGSADESQRCPPTRKRLRRPRPSAETQWPPATTVTLKSKEQTPHLQIPAPVGDLPGSRPPVLCVPTATPGPSTAWCQHPMPTCCHHRPVLACEANTPKSAHPSHHPVTCRLQHWPARVSVHPNPHHRQASQEHSPC